MKKFLSFLLLFYLILLSSCKNFFGGSELITELEEQIYYNNAPTCTVHFDSSTDYGSFLSTGEKTVKIGFPTEFQFNTKTEYFTFLNFIAVDINDTSVSLSDTVRFKNISSPEEQSKGIYKASITVLKQNDNIFVKANCAALPCVTYYFPTETDSAYFSNTPITITFNTAVKPETITKDNIYITCGGENISQFFETPILSEDSKTVTIKSKALELVEFIENKRVALIEVNVAVSDAVKADVAGKEYSIVQDEKSNWKFKYKAEVETVPPQKFDLEFSKKIPQEIIPAIATENLLTQKEFATFTEDDIKTNCFRALVNTVYITGRYFDADSGIAGVIVEEVRTNKKDATLIDRKNSPNKYDFITTLTPDSETAPLNITYEGEGYATFAIPYTLKSEEDGAIKLTVKVLDACANASKEQEITVIRSTDIDISKLNPYNYIIPPPTDIGGHNSDKYDQYKFEEHNASLKTININKSDIKKILYADFEDTNFNPEIMIKYENKDGIQTSEQLQKNASSTDPFYINLDVDSVENLKFTILVGEENIYHEKNSRTFSYPGNVKPCKITEIDNKKILLLLNTGDAETMYSYTYSIDDSNNVFDIKCSTLAVTKQYEMTKPNDNQEVHYYFFARKGSLVGELKEQEYDKLTTTQELDAEDLFFTDVYMDKCPNDETYQYENIVCCIDNELWDKYSNLYIEYLRDGYHTTERKDLDKNSNTISIKVHVSSNWENGATIKLYGVDKDNKLYKGNTLKFPAIQDIPDNSQYDFLPPFVNDKFSQFLNYYILKEFDFNTCFPYFQVEDTWSVKNSATEPEEQDPLAGLKKIEYWTKSNPTVRNIDINSIKTTFDGYNDGSGNTTSGLKNVLPVSLLDIKEDETNLYVRFTDNRNNERTENKNFTIYETKLEVQDIVSGGTPSVTWKALYPVETGSSVTGRFAFYVFTDNKQWSLDTDFGAKNYKLIKGYPNSNKFPEFSDTTTLPNANNKWLKLRLITHDITTSPYKYPITSISQDKIFYTGPASTKNFVNVNSKNILYNSDQEVFIRILTTEYPYEECKNWSRETWERRPLVIKETSLPATDNQVFFNYAGLAEFKNIPEDASFIIITYFADGTVKMSDVMKK